MSQSLKITIKNNSEMIMPVQAALHSYAQLIGFSQKDCMRIELLCEELLSNMIKYDFMPGQTEDIEILAHKSTLGMTINIKSNCIPFNINKITSFENITTEEIFSLNTSGLGVLMVKKLADIVSYNNCGLSGQEIVVEKYLPQELPQPPSKEDPVSVQAEAISGFKYHLRRLQYDDSPIISQLAYYAYKLSYFYEHIYYPERVWQLNQSDELISVVAVNSENGDIIGHCANIRDKISNMMEMGVAFVNPSYRGGGCLNEMATYLFHDIQERTLDGAFVNAVTTHIYSQKTANLLGFTDSCIFISRGTPMQMNNILMDNDRRESLVFMYKPTSAKYSKIVYVPFRHNEIIRKIYETSCVNVTYLTPKGNLMLNKKDKTEIKTDSLLCSHLFIHEFGTDSLEKTKSITKKACINRIETIYLYLPLNHWHTPEFCQLIEERGFFFAGIRPGKDDNDWLVLQYLNNQKYDYESLKLFSPIGQALLNYIKTQDPNNKI